MSKCSCIKELLNNEIVKNEFVTGTDLIFTQACIVNYAIINNMHIVNSLDDVDLDSEKNYAIGIKRDNGNVDLFYNVNPHQASEMIKLAKDKCGLI